jgi:hypothetical protein
VLGRRTGHGLGNLAMRRARAAFEAARAVDHARERALRECDDVDALRRGFADVGLDSRQ